MITNKHEIENLFLRDEVFKIVGCAMRVSAGLGPELLAKLKVGLIFNFKKSRLEWERLAL